MLIHIEGLLDARDLARYRQQLAGADWADGGTTAGALARAVKHNQQLPPGREPAPTLSAHLAQRLIRHPGFIAAALPRWIYPPRFNRYHQGGHYGAHIDAALMPLPEGGGTLRADLAATLFLSPPGDYEGGELCIRAEHGEQRLKPAAGTLVLYPANSLHQVLPVTRGQRLAAILWVQSHIPDTTQRGLLHDLDQSVQSLTAELGSAHPEVVRLSGLYHNLVRAWAEG